MKWWEKILKLDKKSILKQMLLSAAVDTESNFQQLYTIDRLFETYIRILRKLVHFRNSRKREEKWMNVEEKEEEKCFQIRRHKCTRVTLKHTLTAYFMYILIHFLIILYTCFQHPFPITIYKLTYVLVCILRDNTVISPYELSNLTIIIIIVI